LSEEIPNVGIGTALVHAAEMLVTVFGGVTLQGVVRNVGGNLRSLE
jgi:hypothetical protein